MYIKLRISKCKQLKYTVGDLSCVFLTIVLVSDVKGLDQPACQEGAKSVKS